jgi:hypothetical protein
VSCRDRHQQTQICSEKDIDTYISNNCSICNLSSILEDKSIQVIDIDTGSNSREKNNS